MDIGIVGGVSEMVEKGKHYLYALLTYDPVTFHMNMLG
jgi:hypothetical protein